MTALIGTVAASPASDPAISLSIGSRTAFLLRGEVAGQQTRAASLLMKSSPGRFPSRRAPRKASVFRGRVLPLQPAAQAVQPRVQDALGHVRLIQLVAHLPLQL